MKGVGVGEGMGWRNESGKVGAGGQACGMGRGGWGREMDRGTVKVGRGIEEGDRGPPDTTPPMRALKSDLNITITIDTEDKTDTAFRNIYRLEFFEFLWFEAPQGIHQLTVKASDFWACTG